MFMEFILWVSVAFIVFSYAIYPFILAFISALFGKKQQTHILLNDDELPKVTVIIAAYNEEQVIKDRVDNLLQQNYPLEKLTILIGSDGSTDNTNNILSTFNAPQLQAHLFEENRGKANVLNDLFKINQDEIVVLSDANTNFEADAIRRLVTHFTQDKVGAVCGELNLYNPNKNDNKDNIYWKYEQYLKEKEGQLDALLGANGAIYAIRSKLYVPIPKNTIVDDFLIVMNIAKANYSIVYDKLAIANEEIAPSIKEESKRRVRIGTGNYQAFTNLLWALNPFIGWRFFTYFSHKVLRWFTPHFMLITFFINILLLGNIAYNALFALQLLAYYSAYWGVKESKKGLKIPVFVAFLAFFVSMNFSLLKGFYQFAFKNVKGTWQRTSR